MKALLKILYFFLILLLLFLLAGIFFPKTAYIESSVQINALPEIVYDQVNNLKNWNNWEPWQIPDSVIRFNEPHSGKGASYVWTSQNIDQGKISIIESSLLTKISVLMEFGTQGKIISIWNFIKDDGGTKVTWSISNNKLKYFERYFAVFFKKNMINTLNSGLKKLKDISEELRLDRVSEVEEVDLVPGHSLIINDSSNLQDLKMKMDLNYNKLYNYLERKKIETDSIPFAIFYNWGSDGFNKYACGFSITEKFWSWNEYKYFEVPSGHAIRVKHWGKFGSLKPYKCLDNYLEEKHLEIIGYPMEVYISNADMEADTSKWQTNIYYFVKLKE